MTHAYTDGARRRQSTRTTKCRESNGAVSVPFTDFDAYGEWADARWFSGDSQNLGVRDLTIMGLGIAGEAGEVVEKIKKDIRDDYRDPQAILKELGDVVFYAVRIAKYYGFKPSDILKANHEKLEGRVQRGTTRGSGDNR